MKTNNTVWFITGASSGFGLEIAKYGIQQGYTIIATARRIDKLKELQRIAPRQVEAIKVDVTNESEIKKSVEITLAKFGRIDVLFNNAGYGMVGSIEETTDKELRDQFDTNFFGAVNIIKAWLPQFRKQKFGTILNFTSSLGQWSMPGFGGYSASKFALEGISEALKGELAPLGIKVMIIEPGAFYTDFAGSGFCFTTPMDEYKDITGNLRKNLSQAKSKRYGSDPSKLPIAIHKILENKNLPLRFQLGEDSVDTIKRHSKKLLKDLEKWEEISKDVKFD